MKRKLIAISSLLLLSLSYPMFEAEAKSRGSTARPTVKSTASKSTSVKSTSKTSTNKPAYKSNKVTYKSNASNSSSGISRPIYIDWDDDDDEEVEQQEQQSQQEQSNQEGLLDPYLGWIFLGVLVLGFVGLVVDS